MPTNAVVLLIVITALNAWWAIRILITIKRYTQYHGIDIGGIRCELNMDLPKIYNQLYNSRKRDENILRRITKLANAQLVTQAMILATDKKIGELSKLYRTLDNLGRQSINMATEHKTLLVGAKKEIKEANRVLGLFETITKTSNKRGVNVSA